MVWYDIYLSLSKKSSSPPSRLSDCKNFPSQLKSTCETLATRIAPGEEISEADGFKRIALLVASQRGTRTSACSGPAGIMFPGLSAFTGNRFDTMA